VKAPSAGCSPKRIAKGKGVHREVESVESRRQTTGLTNKNHIRHFQAGKAARQAEDQTLPGAWSVYAAGKWSERDEDILTTALRYPAPGGANKQAFKH
jgi:hypothetical protein